MSRTRIVVAAVVSTALMMLATRFFDPEQVLRNGLLFLGGYGFGITLYLGLARLTALRPGESLTWKRVEGGLQNWLLRNVPAYVLGSPALLILFLLAGGFALGMAFGGVMVAAILLAGLLTGGV